jgi:protein SCO1/2
MLLSKRVVNQIIFLLIIIVSIAGGWAASEFYKSKKNKSDIKHNINVEFSLIDHNGVSVSENTYRKKNKVFFFGFTHCPDVCPIGVNLLSNVLDSFELDGISTESLKMFFITVDPKRDTSEKMSEFLSYFNNEIVGLSGAYEDLLPVWENFFVHVKNSNQSEHLNQMDMSHSSHERNNHEYENDKNSEDYIVQHSAFYFIFDKNNELINILPFGSSMDKIKQEIKNIL